MNTYQFSNLTIQSRLTIHIMQVSDILNIIYLLNICQSNNAEPEVFKAQDMVHYNRL